MPAALKCFVVKARYGLGTAGDADLCPTSSTTNRARLSRWAVGGTAHIAQDGNVLVFNFALVHTMSRLVTLWCGLLWVGDTPQILGGTDD